MFTYYLAVRYGKLWTSDDAPETHDNGQAMDWKLFGGTDFPVPLHWSDDGIVLIEAGTQLQYSKGLIRDRTRDRLILIEAQATEYRADTGARIFVGGNQRQFRGLDFENNAKKSVIRQRGR